MLFCAEGLRPDVNNDDECAGDVLCGGTKLPGKFKSDISEAGFVQAKKKYFKCHLL